jgi:hypothetical protein
VVLVVVVAPVVSAIDRGSGEDAQLKGEESGGVCSRVGAIMESLVGMDEPSSPQLFVGGLNACPRIH